MIYIDFETQSGCDLKLHGGRVYASHPSTRILCLGAMWKEQSNYVSMLYVPPTLCGVLPRHTTCGVEIHRALPQRFIDVCGTDVTLCAHNGLYFDRYIWRNCLSGLVPKVDYSWVDTMDKARAAGLPGSLDALGQRLFGRGKDKGKEVLKKVMKLERRPDGSWYNKNTLPGAVATIARYCIRDVELMKDVYERLEDFPYHDPGVPEWTLAVNDRGIRFDDDLGARIAEIDTRISSESAAKIQSIDPSLTPETLRSIPQMKKWCVGKGVRLSNLRQETVEQFINDPRAVIQEDEEEDESSPGLNVSPDVVKVLQLRMSMLRITGKKVAKAFATQVHGRIHDWCKYHPAHTGRFSGSGFQPQNMTRAIEECNVEQLTDNLTYESVVAEADRLRGTYPTITPDDILGSLLRACFIGDEGSELVYADLSAIEPRVLAWVSDEEKLLHVFRNNLPLYEGTAADMYGISISDVTKSQRQVGKVGQLACVDGEARVAVWRLARLSETVGQVLQYPRLRDVRDTDLVWDGKKSVRHGGVIDKGTQECVRVQQLFLTPDHLVLTEHNTWSQAQLVSVCGTGSGRLYNVATARRVPPIPITAAGAYAFMDHGLATVSLSTNTFCISLATTTPAYNWTESILMATTGPGTFASSQRGTTPITSEDTPTAFARTAQCTTRTQRHVYDLLNSQTHRFEADGLVVHNCGYGCGEGKLGDFAASMGIDLVKAGTTAAKVVELYRSTYTKVAGEVAGEYKGKEYRRGGIWHQVEHAFREAVSGTTTRCARCVFHPYGNGVLVTLPSGRSLYYRCTRVEERDTRFGIRPVIVFTSNRGADTLTYGGKLVENIVQAISRDVMVYAGLTLEERGIPIVLHVHDELVAHVKQEHAASTLNIMLDVMSHAPPWACGLPLRATGEHHRRYMK